MQTKKNSGKRTRPMVRTEREQVVKRLRQAGRAYDAGRSADANAARIKRLEARLVEIDTPPAKLAPTPEPIVEDPVVVEEPSVEAPSVSDMGALAALAEMPADAPEQAEQAA